MPDITRNLGILLQKHNEKNISGEERKQLHELLKEKYRYGDRMPEYRCPECKKPFIYTVSIGPACLGNDGCGYMFKS